MCIAIISQGKFLFIHFVLFDILMFRTQTVRKTYITYGWEQSGVAEQSDADYWLRSAVDVGFQSICAETERIFRKNIFILFSEYK